MKYKLEQTSKKTDYFTVKGLLLSKNKLSTELINLIGRFAQRRNSYNGNIWDEK